MNDEFSSLWQAQQVVEHDNEKLKAMWRKRRLRDRLSFAITALSIPVVLWLSISTGLSDAHWSKKVWVIFWAVFCCIYGAGMLWYLRNSMKSITELSSSALMNRMRWRAQMQLKAMRAAKPIALFMIVLLVIFNITFFSTNAEAVAQWPSYIGKNSVIFALAVLVWITGARKTRACQQELDWLNEYETAGEDYSKEDSD